MASLQLWAGPECTVNRVGDLFCDQLELTGFARRIDDLDRLAELGAKRVRFPLLWERTAPSAPDQYQWEWGDVRLQRLRELQVAPIIGLVHHGSGPHYTNLLDRAVSGAARRVCARSCRTLSARRCLHAGQ